MTERSEGAGPPPSKRGMTEEDSESSNDDNPFAPYESQYPRIRWLPPGLLGRMIPSPPPNTNTNFPLQPWDGSNWASIAGHEGLSYYEENDYIGSHQGAPEGLSYYEENDYIASHRGAPEERSYYEENDYIASHQGAPEELSYCEENDYSAVVEVEDVKSCCNEGKRRRRSKKSQDDAVGAPHVRGRGRSLHSRLRRALVKKLCCMTSRKHVHS